MLELHSKDSPLDINITNLVKILESRLPRIFIQRAIFNADNTENMAGSTVPILSANCTNEGFSDLQKELDATKLELDAMKYLSTNKRARTGLQSRKKNCNKIALECIFINSCNLGAKFIRNY